MLKPPIGVLDEHPDWLEPLYSTFKDRGVEFEKIDIKCHSYYPQNKDILPFYINRLSPSALNRNHHSAFTLTLDFILHLESLGARIVNGSHTVLLETSKAQQSSLLYKLGIPQPRTVVLNNISEAGKYLDELNFPILIKPNCGGSGTGIQKYDSLQQFQSVLKNNQIQMPPENVILLQEFIQPAEDYIVRVETINGKVIYAMKVITRGSFNLCPSETCDEERYTQTTDKMGYCAATPSDSIKFELYRNPPKDIVNAVEKIATEARLECGAIEYVMDPSGKWYIYDINALSILRSSFKTDYGIDGWGILADYFIQEYNKVVDPTK